MMKPGATLSTFGVAGALMLSGSAMGSPTESLTPTAQDELSRIASQLDSEIQHGMSVSAYSVRRIALPDTIDEPFHATVEIDGVPVTLFLSPHSVRSEHFQLFVSDGAGGLMEVEPPPSRTYRGFVEGFETSIVSASLADGRLNAFIMLENGETTPWLITPLTDIDADVDSDIHVIYNAADTVHGGWTCGNDHVMAEEMAPQDVRPGQVVTRGDDCLILTQIAYEADFPFYQLNGSSLSATIGDIEFVQSNVNIAYERDLGITFLTSGGVVRTSAAEDPYSTTDAGGLLNQFRSQWLTHHGDISRDIAHLMTGRNLNGSTIGVAWLGAVCSTNIGYGLSQSRFSFNTNARMALTAHEIGHNFNAGHCSGSTCHIMCAGLGGCGGLGNPPKFGQSSINVITSYAANRPCLTDICPTLSISVNNPPDEVFDDEDPTTFNVIVNPSGDVLLPGFDPELMYRIGTSGTFQSVPLTFLGNNNYIASIPGGDCGTGVQYFIRAWGAASGAVLDPPGGSSDPYFATCRQLCPADIIGDGVVGSGDLAILLGSWGESGSIADLDGDGTVSSADLAMMLGTWGPCP